MKSCSSPTGRFLLTYWSAKGSYPVSWHRLNWTIASINYKGVFFPLNLSCACDISYCITSMWTCSSIDIWGKINFFQTSFSLLSVLTLDFYFVTLVWLYLLCQTWDLYNTTSFIFSRVFDFESSIPFGYFSRGLLSYRLYFDIRTNGIHLLHLIVGWVLLCSFKWGNLLGCVANRQPVV